MTKNTKAIIWVSVAVIMLVIALGTYIRQRPKRVVAQGATPLTKDSTAFAEQTQIATSTEAATTTLVSSYKPKPTPPKILSYGEAVNQYLDHRIQFNQICQAIPGQVVFANHITIMLDNRSDVPQKITLAGKTYTVAAYNYTLVTLNQKSLPTTLHVNCNTQMNAVEIVVE
jgi:hypothetical protein